MSIMTFLISALCVMTIYSIRMSSTLPVDSGLEDVNSSDKTQVTLQQAIAIVEKRRLKQCVARLICELSCNPESYGSKGVNVYKTLKKFESDTLPQLMFYKEASNRGKNLQTKCNQCYTLYPNCKTQSETLLRLASALAIKS